MRIGTSGRHVHADEDMPLSPVQAAPGGALIWSSMIQQTVM
jgi:hypothetical protein